jgi:peptidoglycan lytic transglycosylase
LPADKSIAVIAGVRCARLLRCALIAILLVPLLGVVGCGGKKQTSRRVPPAPELYEPEPAQPQPSEPNAEQTRIEQPPVIAPEPVPGIHIDPNARAIWSQIGVASWYGPNYNKKRAANGEIYDQEQMTAAHNTLPLNSVVRVVNLSSHQSTLVRITDRGPFVDGRIIDLSMAAAKAVNVYLPGTAKVRVDVLEAPRPIEIGGRWCIQIGAMQTESSALRLKQHLQRRYTQSQVIEFKGPTGYWVRLRVPSDDKERTRAVYEETRVNEGGVFMVRLD